MALHNDVPGLHPAKGVNVRDQQALKNIKTIVVVMVLQTTSNSFKAITS
jgi:hypothetical protein